MLVIDDRGLPEEDAAKVHLEVYNIKWQKETVILNKYPQIVFQKALAKMKIFKF